MKQTITPPRLPIYTAQGTPATCPRCHQLIAAGEQFIEHSTDGRIHHRCLLTGANKQYIGQEPHERQNRI